MFSTLVQTQPSSLNASSEATTSRQALAWLKAVKSAVSDVATAAAHMAAVNRRDQVEEN